MKFSILLSFLLSLILTPEQKNSVTQIDSLKKKADSFLAITAIDSAIYYYEKASSMALQKEDWDRHIGVSIPLLRIYTRFRNYGKADTLIDNLKEIVTEHRTSIKSLSLARFYYGNCTYLKTHEKYLEALEYLNKAIPLLRYDDQEERNLIIRLLLNKGLVYEVFSDYQASVEFYERAINIIMDVEDHENRFLPYLYYNLSVSFHLIDDYEKSLEYLDKTRFTYEKRGLKNLDLLIGIYDLFGLNLTKLDRFDEAKIYLDKAIDTSIKLFGVDGYATVKSYLNMAVNLIDDEQYEQAVSFLNEHLPYFYEHKYLLARAYGNIGLANRGIGKDQEVVKAFDKMVEVIKAYDYRRDFLPYKMIGDFYFSKNDLNKAIDYYQQELIRISDGFTDLNVFKNPSIEQITQQGKLSMLGLLKNKAEVLKKMAALDSQSLPVIRKSLLSTCHLGIQMIKTLRRQPISNSIKLRLAEANKFFFSEVMNEYLGKSVKSESDSLVESMFHYSETYREGLLALRNAEVSARKYLNLPGEVIEEEKQLKSAVRYYQSSLKNVKSTEDSLESASRLFDARRSLEVLVKDLEKSYPKYYRLKYGSQVVSVKEVQNQLLRKNQVLLEYFVDDHFIYILTITQTQVDARKIKIDSASFAQHIREAIEIAKEPGTNVDVEKGLVAFEHNYSKLYRLLIEPVSKTIKNKDLVIIPDGLLTLLPFELLVASSGKQPINSYRDLPYLLKKHAISYGSSATALFQKISTKNTQNLAGEVLAFAPAFNVVLSETNAGVSKEKLVPLEWAEAEVNSLSQYFETDLLLSENALESALKEKGKNYKIIHIASHGLIDNKTPDYSKIAFHLNQEDCIDDGYLHAFEIYNIELNADMAVLSACNTGYGKVIGGEGAINLARSFFYAGVKSIVMSLWAANDRSTFHVMNEFYNQLSKGNEKDIALSMAKLKYLENCSERKAHPYYWASFVVNGDTRPFSPGKYATSYVIMLFSAFILFMLFYVNVRRKKNVKSP